MRITDMDGMTLHYYSGPRASEPLACIEVRETPFRASCFLLTPETLRKLYVEIGSTLELWGADSGIINNALEES